MANVDLGMVIEWLVKSLVIVLSMTAGFAYVTLYERRLIAKFQVRIGPNRAGTQGLLQPIADAVKLIFKEEFTPTKADKLIFVLAPIITVLPALIITAVVPWGDKITLFGREIKLYLTDLNVAVLYLSAVTSISVYGITLGVCINNF